jgi:hypothetical protein
MSGACGDLNQNCRSKAEKASKEPCPSFEQKKSCWELDRKPIYKTFIRRRKDDNLGMEAG